AFYRWNTRLADLGFTFKEEIIWDKKMITSPVLPLSRVHETVSLHCKKKGKINKCKIPYLEMKEHDIGAIKQDIKRLMSVFSNEKHLKTVKQYLENTQAVYNKTISSNNNYMTFSEKLKESDRSVRVIRNGLKEKSLIRTDRVPNPFMSKTEITVRANLKCGDRTCNCMQSITKGLNEKSIIKQTRDHYTMQHPTQKPVRLMERLMQLVTKDGDVVLDTFMGSGSTGLAAINLNRLFIGYELDNEYFSIAKNRLENHLKEKGQDLFCENKKIEE
ncbi:MAG: site-specific DNA-methyltransferase, partial [Treponemataceae bacterium]